jgi:hypothetical protein
MFVCIAQLIHIVLCIEFGIEIDALDHLFLTVTSSRQQRLWTSTDSRKSFKITMKNLRRSHFGCGNAVAPQSGMAQQRGATVENIKYQQN